MSIEDLQADLTANMAEAKNLSALSSAGDLASHLKNTLWPFLENVVREQAEMDASLRDMYEQSEDILQYETGKQIADVVGGAFSLVDALEKLATGNVEILAAIKEWRARAHAVAEVLEDITLPDMEDEEEDEEEEEEEDEGDEGDKKEAARG